MGELKPCPFCGAGETVVEENHTRPTMSGKSSLISVEVRHWCPSLPGQPSRNYIIKVGRDRESAVAMWNQRS